MTGDHEGFEAEMRIMNRKGKISNIGGSVGIYVGPTMQDSEPEVTSMRTYICVRLHFTAKIEDSRIIIYSTAHYHCSKLILCILCRICRLF